MTIYIEILQTCKKYVRRLYIIYYQIKMIYFIYINQKINNILFLNYSHLIQSILSKHLASSTNFKLCPSDPIQSTYLVGDALLNNSNHEKSLAKKYIGIAKIKNITANVLNISYHNHLHPCLFVYNFSQHSMKHSMNDYICRISTRM